MEKIGDADNISNHLTKPVTQAVLTHYYNYSHGQRPKHNKPR